MNKEKALTVVKSESAVVVRNDQPLSSAQVMAGLNAIRGVMKECMVEKQDYGKVPGCGDKPGLFQPGAQKLSMMFQLNPEVREETITDYPNFHRGYRFIVRVTNGAKFADGVGECSTLESKYRYRSGNKKCPNCGKETIFKSKIELEGWFCWDKKGGCGARFGKSSPGGKEIESQTAGKVEHDNPPDFWNTVRKMAFKRAFVHAIINATNTSELWSQDLEDLAANGVVGGVATETPHDAGNANQQQQETKKEPAKDIDWRSAIVPKQFKDTGGLKLGDIDEKDLGWLIENYKVKETYEKNGKTYKTKPEWVEASREFRAALDAAAKELYPSNSAKAEESQSQKPDKSEDGVRRSTLLQLLRKQMGDKKEIELMAIRFFRNVKPESGKFKDFLLLAEHDTFESCSLDILEGIVKGFNRWMPMADKWNAANPEDDLRF